MNEEIKDAMLALENHKRNNDSEAKKIMELVIEKQKIISFPGGAADLYLDKTGFYYNDSSRDIYFEPINFEITNWHEYLIKEGLDSREKLFAYIKKQLG